MKLSNRTLILINKLLQLYCYKTDRFRLKNKKREGNERALRTNFGFFSSEKSKNSNFRLIVFTVGFII